ncbi:3-oxoacyl-ACP synthase [Desulfovibrio sulfodismutans]|uniref:3-oxoacyl-ACP synthase n=1 Tax=Desulfolutivibrio sulfodismutans TaxID=63561 RepID=A0A7K3NSZ6_9BACT|nr:BrnA antitoxin family protein [Desulfolutivibrio sulfodismutans]NDY58915.1 3-oxoacyl-ACP synthase [Desulfolutivibrio sulfodismutans]QLA13021.1 3-oxoacyl-ACP synthase [Desulfolutivibrio sulfodismutans DSM 3696]
MKRKLKSDMEQVSRFSEEEIARRAASDPDALPTDEAFWMRAVRAEHPAKKQNVTIRLSPGVLEFFKRQGPGYQTRINAVLERYVEIQENQIARR